MYVLQAERQTLVLSNVARNEFVNSRGKGIFAMSGKLIYTSPITGTCFLTFQVKFSGKDWLLTTVNDRFGRALDSYYAVELGSEEKSELFFKDMVPR